MVKNKTESDKVNFLDFALSFYKFKTFAQKYSKKNLIVFTLISMAIFLILNIINSKISLYVLDTIDIVLGLPLTFLLLFSIFFVFLSAFEEKKKPFWESFLVFLACILPFLILGHFLHLIARLLESIFFSVIVYIISLIIFFWLLISLVFNLKNYYNTSGYRIIASFILTIQGFFGVAYLISTLIFL